MIKLNDYLKYNCRNEPYFKNIPESDRYVLFLKNGDLTPLLALCDKLKPVKSKLFIPYISNSIVDIVDNLFANVQLYSLESDSDVLLQCNITHNWSKYIPDDHTIIKLDGDTLHTIVDRERQIGEEGYHHNYETNKVSIIIPHLDSDNLPQITDICKELKEKYSVEYIQLLVTHCFVKEIDLILKSADNIYSRGIKYDQNTKKRAVIERFCIDKIITTNSTSVLDVQKSQCLEVVDATEFFNLD